VLVRAVVGAMARAPVSQAGFFFTLQTLARSPLHRLYIAGHLAFGVAFSILFITSASTRGGLARGAPPSVFLLGLPTVLSFFLIVGLRQAFAVPAELRANWIFQMYAGPHRLEYLAGVRRAIQVTLLPALLALFIPLAAILWGFPAAAVQYAAGLLASYVMLEVQLANLPNLPFTCSHVFGSANLKTWWPIYGIAFLFCTIGFAALERAALHSTQGSLILVAGVGLTFGAVTAWRRSLDRRQSIELVFEELPEGAQELGLQALW
jgi:hypothetical protein